MKTTTPLTTIAMIAVLAAGPNASRAASPDPDEPPQPAGQEPGPATPAPDPEEAERMKKVSAFRERALEMLGDRNYDSSSAPHFAVRTDDPRVVTRAAADLLEAFGRFFEESWSSRMDLLPWEGQTEVLLFYSRFKYDRLYDEPGAPTSQNSIGHYMPYFGVIVAHTDSTAPGDFPGLLVHEAAHQLTYQRIFGPKPAHVSTWLAEGLGSYFGFTRMSKEGTFVAGEIGGAVPALLREHPSPSSEAPRKLLAAFRDVLKDTDPGFLDDLVRTETQELFHVEEELAKYVASWLLVHYLLHGEEGALADAFVKYIKADIEGKGGADVLYELTGRDADALEAGFLAHVKKLKAR